MAYHTKDDVSWVSYAVVTTKNNKKKLLKQYKKTTKTILRIKKIPEGYKNKRNEKIIFTSDSIFNIVIKFRLLERTKILDK